MFNEEERKQIFDHVQKHNVVSNDEEYKDFGEILLKGDREKLTKIFRESLDNMKFNNVDNFKESQLVHTTSD